MKRFLALLAIALMLAPAAVLAQDAPAPVEDPELEAKALFRLGRTAFQAGDDATALEHWNKAYGWSGRSVLKYNIGRAHENLGHVAEAIAAYDSYLKWEGDSQMADEVRGRIVRLKASLASTLPPPQEADPYTRFNGDPSPGKTPPARSPARSPARAPVEPVVASTGKPAREASQGVRWPPIAVLAISGALMLGGGTTGAMALGKDSELHALCGAPRKCAPEDVAAGRRLGADVDSLSLSADIMLALGAVGTAFGIWLLIDGEAEDAPQVACTLDGCSGGMQWQF